MHPPVASMEARIWLLALVPPLLLWCSGRGSPRGCPTASTSRAIGAIVDSLAVTHRLAVWERHHTARFPFGADMIPDSSTSSSLVKGQWEANARETAVSLGHYTIALAIAAILITAGLELRRRRGVPPLDTTEGALETGGAPQLSGPT